MRAVMVLALVCGAALPAAADDAALQKSAAEKVDAMNKALLKGDIVVIADLTHPNVIEMMGGREKMIAQTEALMKDLKEKGIEFVGVAPGPPSDPVAAGDETYIVVPFRLELKTPMGKLTQTTFVIGVTGDAGRSWKFVNGDLDRAEVDKILPKLPKALKLPDRVLPMIEK